MIYKTEPPNIFQDDYSLRAEESAILPLFLQDPLLCEEYCSFSSLIRDPTANLLRSLPQRIAGMPDCVQIAHGTQLKDIQLSVSK